MKLAKEFSSVQNSSRRSSVNEVHKYVVSFRLMPTIRTNVKSQLTKFEHYEKGNFLMFYNATGI